MTAFELGYRAGYHAIEVESLASHHHGPFILKEDSHYLPSTGPKPLLQHGRENPGRTAPCKGEGKTGETILKQ